MSHSTHGGFRQPPAASLSWHERRRARCATEPVFQSRAGGVGQYERPLPPVGCAGMRSTHHERPAGVTRRLQSVEHPVAPRPRRAGTFSTTTQPGRHSSTTRNISSHKPLRAPPSPAPGPAHADVLAREAAAHDVDARDAVLLQGAVGEFADIGVARNLGPRGGEDCAGKRVTFAERDGAQAGAVEADGKAADAAEQVEDIQRRSRKIFIL